MTIAIIRLTRLAHGKTKNSPQTYTSCLETGAIYRSHVSQHAEGCGMSVQRARSDEKHTSHCISVKNHPWEGGDGRNGPIDLISKDSHK